MRDLDHLGHCAGLRGAGDCGFSGGLGDEGLVSVADSIAEALPHQRCSLVGGARINFSKPKKNRTSDPTPKVVQTKISLKAKIPPSANGVLTKEPSPNFGWPTTEEVVGKGKEKVVKPSPKVKPSSSHSPSSSKTTQLGSSSGEKRPSSDSKAALQKSINFLFLWTPIG
ncbi:hypothetical protein Fot_13966 [Forsythia ovata]|uniref:Uncharacterized protein n=1 Tax=Forsythia ovata TaxID=205694 RepID=A0ABD1W797_9LAMI